MSEQPTTQYPAQPAYQPAYPQPKKPSNLMRFGLPVGLLALGLLVGGTAGASAVPEPVTKEVPVEKLVTVTETPQSCKTALDLGGTIIDYSSEAMGYMSDAFTAAGNLDSAGIAAASRNLDTVTPKLKEVGPKYRAARDQCLAG